jgi:hypothetical protein
VGAVPDLGGLRTITDTPDFLTEAGSDHPADVLSWSALAEPDRVRGEKRASVSPKPTRVSTSLLPSYSLIAGGTAIAW